jgi:hypothetical protein
MPVKKENRGRYPPREEWAAIRQHILARAGGVCERCAVADRAIGARDALGLFWSVAEIELCDPTIVAHSFGTSSPKLFKIILTIAHLDHTPENNDYSNLRAWCQKCHNAHDRDFRKANRKATMEAKRHARSI